MSKKDLVGSWTSTGLPRWPTSRVSSAHIRLAVGATPNNTFYLSSLSLALPAFSQNLVANASAHDNNSAPPLDELTSTVLRINNKPHIPYIAPTTRIIKSSPSLLGDRLGLCDIKGPEAGDVGWKSENHLQAGARPEFRVLSCASAE